MHDVEQAGIEAGLPPEQAEAIAQDYGEAQLEALRLALGAVALVALIALAFTRGLQTRPVADESAAPPEQVAVPA